VPFAFGGGRVACRGCGYAAALNAEPRDVLPLYLHAIDHVWARTGEGVRQAELYLSDTWLARMRCNPHRCGNHEDRAMRALQTRVSANR